MSFIYCHLNFHANLLRPWRFPLTLFYHVIKKWSTIRRMIVCYEQYLIYIMAKTSYISIIIQQPFYHHPMYTPIQQKIFNMFISSFLMDINSIKLIFRKFVTLKKSFNSYIRSNSNCTSIFVLFNPHIFNTIKVAPLRMFQIRK